MKRHPPILSRGPAAGELLSALVVACAALGSARASEPPLDPAKLPRPAAGKIDFTRDIAPILENSCFRCHGPNRPKSHFRLDTREMALKGGDDGVDIVPGDSSRSRLVFYAARLVEDKEMPPAGKGDPLTPSQVGLLRAWIDQGVAYSGTNQAPSLEFTIEPTLHWIGVSGNAAKFREQFGMKEGFGGGIQNFSLTEREKDGTTFHTEGQLLFPDRDYKLELRLEKPDLGFVEGGAVQNRTYYNDVGGYYGAFAPSSYSLNQDLHVDDGRAWINFGLNKANLPGIVLGYEYDYRHGMESTLEWGSVMNSGGTVTRNIYPALENIDEHTHILKLDVTQDFPWARMEDSFRAEFYSMDNQTLDAATVLQPQSGAAKEIMTAQMEDHFQAMNAFRLGKDVFDGWYLSAGYLYTRLTGDAAFNQSTFLTPVAAVPPVTTLGISDPFWSASDIVLDQQSHTANLNSFLGPWKGLSLSTGVQAQWMSQEAYGNVQLTQGPPGAAFSLASPGYVSGNLDQARVEERIVLKYDSLPFTILSAEARLQQESLRYNEGEIDGLEPFTQATSAGIDTREFRAGVTSSPWQSISFGFDLSHRETVNNYSNLGLPDIGAYPGFILEHDFTTDEAAAKIVLHPVRWLKATLSYQVDTTVYDLQGAALTAVNPGDVSPGGSAESGRYNSQVYGANLLLTPWQRATISGSFNYFDSRVRTADNGLAAVQAYSGGTFLTQTQFTYALDDHNDLRAGYSFSQSNFGQDNAAAGLPLGLDYTFHGVKVGLVHKMKGNKSIALEYGYYRYDEPTSGSANNYQAQTVFATFTTRWP